MDKRTDTSLYRTLSFTRAAVWVQKTPKRLKIPISTSANRIEYFLCGRVTSTGVETKAFTSCTSLVFLSC
jgi:hypothetical protein